jgi:hypothetical protein
MNGNCGGGQRITSWYGLQQMSPMCPLDLIANAKFGNIQGALKNSTNFGNPGSWTEVGSNIVIASAPVCIALGTDSQQKVEDAAQWNFSHLTWKGDSTVAPPLRRTIFLRAGNEWLNRIQFTISGMTPTNVQLSFLSNAATRGDDQGTWPVIDFTGTFVGATLEISILGRGPVQMGMLVTNSTTYYMYDLLCIAVS